MNNERYFCLLNGKSTSIELKLKVDNQIGVLFFFLRQDMMGPNIKCWGEAKAMLRKMVKVGSVGL